MSDYRGETFFQYIWKYQSTTLIAVVIFLCAVLALPISDGFYKSAHDVAMLLVLLCLFTLPAWWYFGLLYRLYDHGRKAYEELARPDRKVLYDVKLLIKGYDVLSRKKSLFNFNVLQPIYQFYVADVVLSGGSMLLLGIGTTPTGHAAPVEISKGNGLSSAAQAKLIAWKEENGRIQIEIQDPGYPKPFKIVFREQLGPIRDWLLLLALNT